MKKLIIGLVCGIFLTIGTQTFASSTLETILFPVKYIFNGAEKQLSGDYVTLNYKGHTYVPVRFIGENLGAIVFYDDTSKTIYLNNTGKPDNLTDPDYNGISVGNLILTKDGQNTKVTGQLKMENMGNEKNMVGAKLSFYNDKAEKIGEVAITGTNFGNTTQTFEAIGTGDFRVYSTVKLHIGAVNYNIIGGGPK
jgi:hypothetical protein